MHTLHVIYILSLWRFPEIGVPPVLIHLNGIFPYKPSSYGGTSIYGNAHIVTLACQRVQPVQSSSSIFPRLISSFLLTKSMVFECLDMSQTRHGIHQPSPSRPSPSRSWRPWPSWPGRIPAPRGATWSGLAIENQWKIMGKPWKTRENGKSWTTHGKPMENHGKPWTTHGHLHGKIEFKLSHHPIL